jgi:hypothetical protein
VRGRVAAARAAAACLFAIALLSMSLSALVPARACGARSLAWPPLALLCRLTRVRAASHFNCASLYPQLVTTAALPGLALAA